MRGGRKWHTHMAVEAQLERDHLLIAALSLSGIGLTLLENELLRLNGGEPSSSCEALKLLCSALTGCQIFSIGHFYRRRFHHLKTTNTLLREDTLQSSGLFSCALVEICAALVHAPPFVSTEVYAVDEHHRDDSPPIVLSTDEIAACLMLLLRLPPLANRFLRYAAGIESESNRLYANWARVERDSSLALRLTLKRAPATFLAAASATLLGTLAVLLSSLERRANPALQTWGDAMWTLFGGMIGVSFVEHSPMTVLGKLVTSAAMLWGLFAAALVVLCVLQQCALTDSEARLAELLHETELQRVLKGSAARFIQAAWAGYLEHLRQAHQERASLLGKSPLTNDEHFCQVRERERVETETETERERDRDRDRERERGRENRENRETQRHIGRQSEGRGQRERERHREK